MNNLIKLKIPFATIGWIKQSNKLTEQYTKGYVYYIFDLSINRYISDYIQLEESNFRKTDSELVKTAYYKKHIVKNFRNNYLDKFTNNYNDGNRQMLTTEEITIINNEFLTLNTTSKTMFSLLSGSNISGAKTNPNSTPLKCLEPEYYGYNFSNPLKEYSVLDKYKTTKYNSIPLKEYSLSEAFKTNIIPDLEIVWNKYNNFSFKYKTKNPISFNVPEDQEVKIYGIINKTLVYKNKNNTKQHYNRVLRTLYESNVRYFLKSGWLPYNSTIFDYDNVVIQSCHIIPFAELVNSNEYSKLLEAIDPFNCLRLDANTHIRYDKHHIYFDENGMLVDVKHNNEKIKFLNLETLPNKSIEYIKKYCNNFKN